MITNTFRPVYQPSRQHILIFIAGVFLASLAIAASFLLSSAFILLKWPLGLVLIGGLGLIFGCVIIIVTYTIRRHLREGYVRLTDTVMVYHSWRFHQSVAYTEIEEMHISESQKGEIVSIRLITTANGRILLSGYGDMPQLARELALHLPDKRRLRKRQTGHPYRAIILLSLLILVLLVVLMNMPSGFYGWQFLFFTGLGLSHLMGRRLTKHRGIKYRKLEIVLGVLCLGVAGLNLMMIVVFGKPLASLTHPCGLVGRFWQRSGCIQVIDRGEYAIFLNDTQMAYDDFYNIYLTPVRGLVTYWTPRLEHDDFVQVLTASANGRTLAAWTFGSSHDKDVLYLWETETQTLLQRVEMPDTATERSALSPDGRWLAVGLETGIEIWHIQPWEKQLTIAGKGPVAFSADGHFLAGVNESGALTLWRAADGIVAASFEESERPPFVVKTITFSPDGQWLAAAYHDGHVLVWGADGRLHHQWHEAETHFDFPAAFSPDSQLIAVGFSNQQTSKNYVNLWDMASGHLHKMVIVGEGYDSIPQSLSFSPDGRTLAIGTDDGVFVFDTNRLLH